MYERAWRIGLTRGRSYRNCRDRKLSQIFVWKQVWCCKKESENENGKENALPYSLQTNSICYWECYKCFGIMWPIYFKKWPCILTISLLSSYTPHAYRRVIAKLCCAWSLWHGSHDSSLLQWTLCTLLFRENSSYMQRRHTLPNQPSA